jgi:mannose-1-phosphate guanylyltransferase
MDQERHFWQRIKKTKQLLMVQEIYLKYYSRVDKNILTQPVGMALEQVEGLVCVHPTAEVHPGAKLGPNVTVGAHAKIGDGVRVINSIILEDAVVNPHAVVINSIVGWSAVIGSWTRIEGLLTKNDHIISKAASGGGSLSMDSNDLNQHSASLIGGSGIDED